MPKLRIDSFFLQSGKICCLFFFQETETASSFPDNIIGSISKLNVLLIASRYLRVFVCMWHLCTLCIDFAHFHQFVWQYLYMLTTSLLKVQMAVELLEDLIANQNRRSLDDVYITASVRCLMLDIMMNHTSVVTKSNLCYHAWHCQREHASLFNSMSTYSVKSCEFTRTIFYSFFSLN